jgi:hypothetical protein
MEQLQ